ncbi:MAG: phosphoglycerate kinase [Bacteroidia bacterium]|nr:phosphoglycerate kinase [Bacteroidia bacterium]
MKTVAQFNFNNERVVMRVDFNVPLDVNKHITDDSRIREAVPTINKVLKDGGSVVLMSHLGRPKEGAEDKFSLKHIVSRVSDLTGAKVFFADDCIGEQAVKLASALKPGEILLLENLRFYKEETKGDTAFAQKLAKLGTFYVNDAFGTAHRAHASTAIIAQFFPLKKCFGYLMAKEIENAQIILNHPPKPFTAIVGGAKVSDKLLIIENLMNIAQNILIGGGMAYTFAKAMGGKIGNSLSENDKVELCKELIQKAKTKNVNLVLPVDSVIADKFAEEAMTDSAKNNAIPDGWMGLDIGMESVQIFCTIIENSKVILWNGPMGVFEMEKFSNGTRKVAESLAKATDKGAFTLIGGGDSAAAVRKFGFADKVSYISTGGGALLEYFEGKELPGIAAIEDASQNI